VAESFPIPFGRYQLIERLAIGGMAELFIATAPGEHGFEKKVVIKRLLPHLNLDPTYNAMFVDEAKLTARLVHPKIAQTFELAREGDMLFIAMEYVEGIDVLALLRECAQQRRRIDPALAVWICHEVLDALDYAHHLADDGGGQSLNIVHRDISPSNVLLSSRGDVKLVDFGIARAADPQRSHKTKSGTLKGKYGYMSPEQVIEHPLDQRSDLFSVGVVLAELLTGRRLFAAANELDVLLMVRDARLTRLDKYGADLDPELQELVRKALRKNPDERWSTAAIFRDAINEWLFETRNRITSKTVGDFVAEIRDAMAMRHQEAAAMDAVNTAVLEEAQAPALIVDRLPPRQHPRAQSQADGIPISLELGGDSMPVVSVSYDESRGQSAPSEIDLSTVESAPIVSIQVTSRHRRPEAAEIRVAQAEATANAMLAQQSSQAPHGGRGQSPQGGPAARGGSGTLGSQPPYATQAAYGIHGAPASKLPYSSREFDAAYGIHGAPTSQQQQPPTRGVLAGTEQSPSYGGQDSDAAYGIHGAPASHSAHGSPGPQPPAQGTHSAPSAQAAQGTRGAHTPHVVPSQQAPSHPTVSSATRAMRAVLSAEERNDGNEGRGAPLSMTPGEAAAANAPALAPMAPPGNITRTAMATAAAPAAGVTTYPSIAAAMSAIVPMEPDPSSRDFDGKSVLPGRRSAEPPMPSPDELARKRPPTPPPLGDIQDNPDDAGDFSVISPLRVLFRLMLARSTGLLVVAIGGIKKEVYVRDGQPEYVSSNVASELFGSYLVTKGVLSDGELAMALAMMPHYGGRLGDTLVGLGLLKPLEVFRHLTRQVRTKLIDVCTWNKGTFAWYANRENAREAFPLDFNAFEILGAGAMALPDDVVDTWLARNSGARLRSVKQRRLGPERFEVKGLLELFDFLDGRRTIGDLVELQPDRSERLRVGRMLCLLEACDMAKP
jgi:serine/threonine protein kinase